VKLYDQKDRRPGSSGFVLVNENVDETLSMGFGTKQTVERVWLPGSTLNQGSRSCCVGCAVIGFLNADPIRSSVGIDQAFDLYRRAQRIDNLVGEEPEAYGTTVKAGIQVAMSDGLIQNCEFTKSATEAWNCVVMRGPVVVGVPWYSGMATTDSVGMARVRGRKIGGHAFLVYGVSVSFDSFMCLNSHGKSYGVNGRFMVRFDDMEELLKSVGAMAASPIQRS
jgi:hypothetical protein